MKVVEWPDAYYEKFSSENTDVIELNERKDRMHSNLKKRPKLSFIGKLTERYFDLFLNTYLYDIGEKEAWKFYITSMMLKKQHLKVWNSNGKKVEVNILGETLLIQDSSMRESAMLVEGWKEDLSRAVVARDIELIKMLVDLPSEKVQNDRNKYEEYVFKYYEFLKALYTEGDETYPEKLKEAILYTFPDKLKWSRIDDPRFMLLKMKMYLFVLSGDEEELNKTIVEYLETSKTFILEIREGMQWYSDFIKIGVLEICSIAHDRGMKINVQSPYIPEWLYKGEFRNWK